MKVKINETIKSLSGEDVVMNDPDNPGESKKLTLGVACINALMFNEKDLSGKEKVRRFKLASKIYDSDNIENAEIDVTSEDISTLKDLINKTYPSPLVVGQAWALLDPVAQETN